MDARNGAFRKRCGHKVEFRTGSSNGTRDLPFILRLQLAGNIRMRAAQAHTSGYSVSKYFLPNMRKNGGFIYMWSKPLFHQGNSFSFAIKTDINRGPAKTNTKRKSTLKILKKNI